MSKKSRLSNIFGLKLLPVSGEMTSTAKSMLDQETEYLDYLRNRKKFFVMTQIQQTRVQVVKKRKKKNEGGGGAVGMFPPFRRRKMSR